MWQKLDRFHKTVVGYLFFGLIELAAAYAFASLAIDRGNFWYYLLAFILLIGFLENFFGLLGKVAGRGHKSTKARRN